MTLVYLGLISGCFFVKEEIKGEGLSQENKQGEKLVRAPAWKASTWQYFLLTSALYLLNLCSSLFMLLASPGVAGEYTHKYEQMGAKKGLSSRHLLEKPYPLDLAM